MEVWSIEFSRDAAKTLLRMPTNTAALIRKKIDLLAQAPFAPNANVKALRGRPAFRLRVGDWRVIYELDHGRIVVLVLDIGPRGSIYE